MEACSVAGRVGLAPPSGSLGLLSRIPTPEINNPCHLERVSPRTSRKVPTGPEGRRSRRTASILRGTHDPLADSFAPADSPPQRLLAGGTPAPHRPGTNRAEFAGKVDPEVVEPVPSGTTVALASRRAGLLIRLRIGGVPASSHRRGRAGVTGGGCDHADGTPAACLVAGTAAPGRWSARVARHRHCAERGGQPVEHRRHNAVPGTPRRAPEVDLYGRWSRHSPVSARGHHATRLRLRPPVADSCC